jgi:hypothetical protein
VRGSTTLIYSLSFLSDIIKGDSRLDCYIVDNLLCGTTYKENGCSNCKDLLVEIKQTEYPELQFMALKSEFRGTGQQQHPICQEFFLKDDEYFKCYELPVYSNEDDRSGFIDIVRFKNNVIEICDVKPEIMDKPLTPSMNRKIASQLFHYKRMLKERIGDDYPIKCYAFSEQGVYELVE